jgi:hypothetical protein
MNRYVRASLLLLPALTLAACAVRLGGPGPERYDAAALFEPLNADADAVARRIRETGAEIVLLASERQDSAYFSYIAAQAGLGRSRPGAVGGRGYAFMTNLELLGDTTLSLAVPGGGAVHMHDALFKIDRYRNIDLMLVRLEATDVRAAVRALLGYIATDVGADASVLLAIDGASQSAADSAAILMRATFGNAAECAEDSQPVQPAPVRLLYGPSARLSCLSARNVAGTTPGIVARIEVGR